MIYIVDLAAVLAVAAGSSRTLGAHVFRCGWPALYLGHVRPVWGGMRCQQPGAECAVMHVQELRGPTLPSGLPGKGDTAVVQKNGMLLQASLLLSGPTCP
jgi:hypothetical protein